jgi:hypothetical protein
MWLQREKPKSQIEVAGSIPPSPIREEILSSLTELNMQCLELMAEQGRVDDGTRIGSRHLLREVTDRWGDLDAEARRRAASCPYLLVDASFGDTDRWRSRGFTVQSADTPAFFTVERCLIVARQVFLYAWHLSNSQKFNGRAFLGMSSGCMEALRSYTLPQVIELAEHSTHWICPRWPHLVGFWRELLLAARSGEFAALEAAKMHGISLLAADIRSASVHALQVERAADTTSGNGPPSRVLPCESGRTLLDQVAGGGRAFPRRPSD